MKVFILFDENDHAYPILGVYSTLEKAKAAVREPSPHLCVYEEALDEVGETIEPVYHKISPKEEA